MARIVAIRHVAFEDCAVFGAVLSARGHRIEYVNAWDGDWAALAADPPALLIVLGGPIGVYETDLYPFLRPEIDAVGARLAAGLPTLGLCLGAQIMAASQGCAVFPAGVKEIGFIDITLTDAGRAGVLGVYGEAPRAFHWHGDTFDLPVNATLLASTPGVRHQAFAIGEHGLAFQFHPEFDPSDIEAWLVGHTCELNAARIDIPALRADAALHAAAMRAKAERVAHAIADQFGL